MNGEHALWCEVLHLAIQDALHGARIDGFDAKRKIDYTLETRRFLTTPSKDLAELCRLADVDMELLIERMVKQITAAPAAETLFPRRKTNAKVFELDGVNLSLPEWGDRYGINDEVVRARMKKGMPLREALETPVAGGGRR